MLYLNIMIIYEIFNYNISLCLQLNLKCSMYQDLSVYMNIHNSKLEYIILLHGTMLVNIPMQLLINKIKKYVMLIRTIQVNYVLKQLLLEMTLHILEQLIVGHQNKLNINAYIINNHLIHLLQHLFQILQILNIKVKHIFITNQLNIIE